MKLGGVTAGVTAAALALSACSSSSSSSSGGTGGASGGGGGKKVGVSLILKTLTNPYFVSMAKEHPRSH
jgi:fructose transport system substrate-binding protein